MQCRVSANFACERHTLPSVIINLLISMSPRNCVACLMILRSSRYGFIYNQFLDSNAKYGSHSSGFQRQRAITTQRPPVLYLAHFSPSHSSLTTPQYLSSSLLICATCGVPLKFSTLTTLKPLALASAMCSSTASEPTSLSASL